MFLIFNEVQKWNFTQKVHFYQCTSTIEDVDDGMVLGKFDQSPVFFEAGPIGISRLYAFASPALVPTPAPVRSSCSSTSGQCFLDPRGSQARDCIAACKCIAPHNCGVHNNTISCGVSIIGCSVCDVCCEPWITAQSSCDGFFEAPVPNGCGNQTNQPTPAPTPVVAYGCNSTTGPKRITVARRMQCNLQATDPRSNTKSYTSADASADTHDVHLQHNDGALRGGPDRPAIAGRVHRHLQAVTPIPSLLSLSLG